MLPALARVDDQTPLRGRTIERVHAAGKHLLIEFSGGLALRTHLRMNGSWHIYRSGERWQRSRIDMRIVIATADWEAVGFNVPVAEFCEPEKPVPIGPDLLADEIDVDLAVDRVRARPHDSIAEALVDDPWLSSISPDSFERFFDDVGPYLLEDLNKRGLSPEEVLPAELARLMESIEPATPPLEHAIRPDLGLGREEPLWKPGGER